MTVSRRTFSAPAAAGSVLAAVGAGKLAADRSAPVTAVRLTAADASAPGDVVGKITVGYQGWFACIGAWPDMSEYTNVFQTAYAPLGTGAPATLFSSFDQQTVSTHFLGMQQNGWDN